MSTDIVPTITNLISNVGFPIAMCLLMMWYIYTSQSKLTEAINELRETMVEVRARLEAMDK